jgi:hypothetical protein
MFGAGIVSLAVRWRRLKIVFQTKWQIRLSAYTSQYPCASIKNRNRESFTDVRFEIKLRARKTRPPSFSTTFIARSPNPQSTLHRPRCLAVAGSYFRSHPSRGVCDALSVPKRADGHLKHEAHARFSTEQPYKSVCSSLQSLSTEIDPGDTRSPHGSPRRQNLVPRTAFRAVEAYSRTYSPISSAISAHDRWDRVVVFSSILVVGDGIWLDTTSGNPRSSWRTRCVQALGAGERWTARLYVPHLPSTSKEETGSGRGGG